MINWHAYFHHVLKLCTKFNALIEDLVSEQKSHYCIDMNYIMNQQGHFRNDNTLSVDGMQTYWYEMTNPFKYLREKFQSRVAQLKQLQKHHKWQSEHPEVVTNMQHTDFTTIVLGTEVHRSINHVCKTGDGSLRSIDYYNLHHKYLFVLVSFYCPFIWGKYCILRWVPIAQSSTYVFIVN